MNNDSVEINKVIKALDGKVMRVIDSEDTVILIEEFKEWVACGAVTDDDGSGYYSLSTSYCHDEPAYPSDIHKGIIKEGWTHVVWFNK